MALQWSLEIDGLDREPKEKKIQPTYQKHLCSLNIHQDPSEEILTSIMCEINVYNKETANIQKLLAAGVTIARLNLRNMDTESRNQVIQSIRQAVYNYSSELNFIYPLALAVDITGPGIVTGELKGGPRVTIELRINDCIKLTTDETWKGCGTENCLYVSYDKLTDLQAGDIIYIDSLSPGRIMLCVADVGDDSVDCVILEGGMCGPKMPVRVPLIVHDKKDLKGEYEGEGDMCDHHIELERELLENAQNHMNWAINAEVDALFIPCVQTDEDVTKIKSTLVGKGKRLLIMSSIETMLGLKNIDSIINESDGIYLDRSILCLDLPIEKVFIAQKQIAAKCNHHGKSFICKAVLNEEIPTLCVTDIANMVFDGADVIELEFSYESPMKNYPDCQPAPDPSVCPTHQKKVRSKSVDFIVMIENCISAACVVCRQAESILWKPRMYGNIEMMRSSSHEPSRAICISAVELASRTHAAVIISLTSSGRTARLLAHGQSPCPVIAVTRSCHVARQLRFWRGLRTLHYYEQPQKKWLCEVQSRVDACLEYCRIKALVAVGDPYIVVCGSGWDSGYCNTIRLYYLGPMSKIVDDINNN